MEVVKPVLPPLDLHKNDSSSCSTPFISAPSSPKLFNHELYFSAPTSPTKLSALYSDFNNNGSHRIVGSSSIIIPFDWEEKPGKPKSIDPDQNTHDLENDFAFDFSGQLEKLSLSAADELFHGGKIRPLKPPPRLIGGFNDDLSNRNSLVSSPRSPISQGKKIIREAFSPRYQRNKDIDPFAVAIETTRNQETEHRQERGRTDKKKKSGHRWTRSLSPFRVSELINFEENPESEQEKQSRNSKPNSSNSNSSRIYWPFRGYRKWKLKDLLFRSSSEGRANEKDQLRNFAVLSKRDDEVKCASFRSTDSTGSVSSSRRRTLVSPHEFHYTVNRAVSEELRKKTFLPYKQGLLGCLGFSPTAHGLAKGLNL